MPRWSVLSCRSFRIFDIAGIDSIQRLAFNIVCHDQRNSVSHGSGPNLHHPESGTVSAHIAGLKLSS